MERENLILIEQLCSQYQIELSFIRSLSEYGLIEIVEIERIQYVANDQLKDIEKMIRLHVDLGINMEGIDVIFHLLRRMERLHGELRVVRNKLDSGRENDVDI